MAIEQAVKSTHYVYDNVDELNVQAVHIYKLYVSVCAHTCVCLEI